MKSAAKLAKAVLSLPPSERAHLALAAWESLVADPEFEADRAFDPEGVKMAVERDREIESGKVKPLSHEEFLRRTLNAGK